MKHRHYLSAVIVPTGILGSTLEAVAEPPAPFQDAVVVWHMKDVKGSGRIASRPEHSGRGSRRVFFFSQDGEVVFESVDVRPLIP